MNVAKVVGEIIALAFAAGMVCIAAFGMIDRLLARKEHERLDRLERRAEKLTCDTQALIDEQLQRDDEQSALRIADLSAQEKARVYDQDVDQFERQYEPTDMGWAIRAGMYGTWEDRMAREAAAEQAKHLAGDEWERELSRWMNWTPKRER